MKLLYIFLFSTLPYFATGQKIKIELVEGTLKAPITETIARKSTDLLNLVFNLPEFKDSLIKYNFVCTNRPSFCKEGEDISGTAVFDDFVNKRIIKIRLKIKHLLNPWKRFVSRTLGETDPNGTLIVTYPWWLDDSNIRNLTIDYAAHVGHEIFHTSYFGYIHDPKINSKKFVNKRDVTYKIDDIIESLLKKYYQ